MRREHSLSTLSISTSPHASSDRSFCDYRKLNFVAFASTLIYIGYLVGCMEKNHSGQVVASAFSVSRGDVGGGGGGGGGGGVAIEEGGGRLRPSYREASARRDRIDEGGFMNERTTGGSVLAYAKGPVVHNHKGKGTSISLIGERHSGTNWITDHLTECFGNQITVEPHFTRFKHWFQFDDATVRNDSAVVVAMFRDPYDWIEAMRERPHHAHGHIGVPEIGMEWRDFVTKPWVGPRGPADRAKMEQAKEEGRHIEKAECLAGYKFDEVIPCSYEDSVVIDGYSSYMYELRDDGSHRAFNSVGELRAAKIRNFLRVPTFHGVKAFFPERYEALNLRGTADFLRKLEEVTGLKADCKPLQGTGSVRHKDVDPQFTKWMNDYHDWEAEAMIGYVRREPVPRGDPSPKAAEEEGSEGQNATAVELEGLPPPEPSNAQVY